MDCVKCVEGDRGDDFEGDRGDDFEGDRGDDFEGDQCGDGKFGDDWLSRGKRCRQTDVQTDPLPDTHTLL